MARKELQFNDLPNELAVLILGKLEFTSKFLLRRVCRKWNLMLQQKSLYTTLEIMNDDIELLKNGAPEETDQLRLEQLIGTLTPRHLTTNLKHLILVGDYNYSLEDLEQPTARDDPVRLSNWICDLLKELSRTSRSGEDQYDDAVWRKLEKVTIKNAAVDPSCHLVLGKRRLTLANVSLLCSHCIIPVKMEFFIDSFSAKMSGHQDCLWRSFDEVSEGCKNCFETRVPVELVELYVKEAQSLTPAKLLGLKDVYEKLVEGREGCAIRFEVLVLFHVLESHPGRGDADHQFRRWSDHFKDDFVRLDPFWRLFLLYRSKPRNFFRLASAEELASGEDSEGDVLVFEYKYDPDEEFDEGGDMEVRSTDDEMFDTDDEEGEGHEGGQEGIPE